MNFLSKLSPTAKMILGFGSIIVSIILLVFFSYRDMNHIHNSQNSLDDLYGVTRGITQLRGHENRLRAYNLELILAKDKSYRDTTKKQMLARISEAKILIDSMEILLEKDPEFLGLFKEIKTLLIAYDETRNHLLTLIDQGKNDEAYQYTINIQNPQYEPIWLKIRILEKKLLEHITLTLAENDDILQSDLFGLILLGSIVVLISVILAVWMVKMLHKITFEIKNGVTVLGTSAAEILSTVSEISTGATETATAISETTTTVEEVRQTAMVANQKARALMESSQKATESADKGMESVQQVIDSMKKIDKQMNIIAETVVKLSEQNRSIGEITSTVTDIADQSNLLAVNAAIEAAKAGEQGRGFAVVAQEIRSLADQSKKATIQIKEILNEIQKSVNLSVDVTEKGSSTVAEGIQLVTKSGNVIGVLAEHVEAAVQISVQISSSSQQQMAGMEQVVPAMENIKQASEQNVAGIRQAQGAATDLNLLGQKIQGIIEKYNL